MRSTGFTLGEHAVNGFFAVSGFLVTMSFDRRGWRDYVVARALRIVPALVAATLVTALLLGPALTRLPLAQYLADPALWRFIALTPTTFKSATALPGLFSDNVFPYPMGTVWTLKYEMLCYLGVFAARACRADAAADRGARARRGAVPRHRRARPPPPRRRQGDADELAAAVPVCRRRRPLSVERQAPRLVDHRREPSRGDVARGRHAALQGTALRASRATA